MLRILLIFSLFLIFVETAQLQELPLEDEISRLDSLNGEELLEEVLLLYDSLARINDYRIKVGVTNRVLEITKGKDELAHAVSEVSKVRFAISDDFSLFEKAYSIAKNNDNKEMMVYFDEWQVKCYLEQGIYDKAMLYLLRLRDLSEELGYAETHRHALNVMGDIYYSAKLMEQAKELYEEILQYYIDNNEWDYWRPYMLMNNLGEIALFNDNISKADYWFSRSIEIADTSLNQPYKYNTMAYTKLKLCEVLRLSGDYEKAFDLITQVEEYPDGSIFEDVVQELYYQKAMWYLGNKQFDKSLQISIILYPSEPVVFTEYRFVPEVYKLMSEIYQGKKLYRQSLTYLQKYTHISDSIEKQSNIVRSIILLANKNHKAIQDELEIEKKLMELEQQKMIILNEAERKKQNLILYFLLVGTFLLVLIIVVISRSNIHRRKANQLLNLQKQEIQKYVQELRTANNTKDKFFSIIAHDLKGPVGTLNNLLQLLTDRYEEIDNRERLKILISAGKSSNNSYKLLMNLLDWSRSQQGKVEFNPREFNIRNSIESVYMLIKDSAFHKNQKVNIQVSKNISIINDISMFETVLRNLLSNAVKFTPEGGDVVVSAYKKKDKVTISVKDSGIGIPKEMIPKLFDTASKIQRNGTNSELGTGLGLLLCKEFVGKMGGTIVASSEEGEGSLFVISL